VVLPEVTQEKTALVERGSQILSGNARAVTKWPRASSAPSYQEIVTFYRREIRTVDRREFPDLCGNPGWSLD